MSKSPCDGHGRPPQQDLRQVFNEALISALNGNRRALRDARPTTTIEAIARKLALDALDGRAAQKFVLEILDGADGDAAARRMTWARPRRGGPCASKRPDERGEESNEEDDEDSVRAQTNVIKFPASGNF